MRSLEETTQTDESRTDQPVVDCGRACQARFLDFTHTSCERLLEISSVHFESITFANTVVMAPSKTSSVKTYVKPSASIIGDE